MPNLIDANGLQTATRQELIDYFTAQYKLIYGNDINLDSDSPDGQMMNIYVQSQLDSLDLTRQVYNMQDPDNAIGVILDQRIAINGIQRQDGTFTVTNITVITTQSVNLYGKDQEESQNPQPVYTVSDNAGNLWELQTTQLALSVGTNVLSFQAKAPGEQFTIPNTITVQVTIVLGVSSVNNPTTYTTLGINEETDAQAKIRRQKSVSLASQGYLAGLLAALENIPGVTSAFVYENDTSVTNGDGVPGHSIWVIVAGTGTAAAIAQAIYTKRNGGCGMFGTTLYTITQVDGSPFIVKWDTVITQNLFITFTATSINGVTAPNIEAIREGLVTSYVPGVNEEVNINTLATLVQQIDSNTLVTGAGFSLAMIQTLTLSGVSASGVFRFNYNGNQSVDVNWNDSIGVIETKLKAVTGLSAATLTGSIASQSLVANLTLVGGGILGLITISNNTLATSAPVPVTFAYNEGFANTLSPSSKRNQLVVSEADIIIVPMLLTPATSSVVSGNSQTFVGFGGYGTYVYSIQTNNSGGSIVANTGVYTSGPTATVTDTILVTDQLGNTATATVAVV